MRACDVPRAVGLYYGFFIHVAIMIYIGFGYLMTFLRRFAYSAVGMNFVLVRGVRSAHARRTGRARGAAWAILAAIARGRGAGLHSTARRLYSP